MSKLYAFTEEQVEILRSLIDRERRRIQKAGTQDSPIEPDDHQAPEVYLVKPQEEEGIPAMTPGESEEDPDVPGEAMCDAYEIFDGEDGPELREAVLGDLQVYNFQESVVPQDYALAVRDKFGRWILVVGGEQPIVGACLAEDHPGQGLPFEIYLGTWNPNCSSENSCPECGREPPWFPHWDYDCSTGKGEIPPVYAIDWRYDTPYPDAGATGLFVSRPVTPEQLSGTGSEGTGPKGTDFEGGCLIGVTTIYEVVSLDCSSPGPCCEE